MINRGKRFFILTIFLLITLSAQSILFSQEIDWKPMSPILDNTIDPSLRFMYCKGAVQSINKEVLPKVGFTKKMAKEFKSQKVTQMQERWVGSDKSVEIYRWYLENPEDASTFICTEFAPIGIKWSATPDIGDKTSWPCGGNTVYFTKGNVLVKVLLNSKLLIDDKNYTKKIAQNVAKKL